MERGTSLPVFWRWRFEVGFEDSMQRWLHQLSDAKTWGDYLSPFRLSLSPMGMSSSRQHGHERRLEWSYTCPPMISNNLSSLRSFDLQEQMFSQLFLHELDQTLDSRYQLFPAGSLRAEC